MTAFTLGEAAAIALGRVRAAPTRSGLGRVRPARSGATHRTGQPVLRDSMEAGTFEEHFFSVPARGECDRLLRTARAALDAGRRLKRAARVEGRELSGPERALAGITAGAVRVYEELCTLARLNAGRVFPTYDHLATATALGRATVARALRALEAAGFLVRQRRFRRVKDRAEGRAGGDATGGAAVPRYAQTSNVYRPTVPARVAALLSRWLRPAPVPDDQLQREADRVAEGEAMHAGLTCRELAQATVGGPLGRMLARLGAAIDGVSCESHDNPQSLMNSCLKTPAVLA